MYQLKEIDAQIQNAFVNLCRPGARLWVLPDIPQDKVQKACKHFLFLKKDEHLLGLADESVLGGGQDGYAFTTQRIYWKNPSHAPDMVRYIDLNLSAQLTGGIFAPRLGLDAGKVVALNMTEPHARASLVQFVNFARGAVRQQPGTATTPVAGTPPVPGASPFAAPAAPLQPLNPLEALVMQTCAHYRGPGFFVAELIPPQRLTTARQHFPIAPHVRVLALLDTTVMGSGGRGIAFCDDGLRWSEYLGKGYLPWNALPATPVHGEGSQNIKIGTYPAFQGSIGIKRDSLVELLQRLQSQLAQGASPSPSTTTATPTSWPPSQPQNSAPAPLPSPQPDWFQPQSPPPAPPPPTPTSSVAPRIPSQSKPKRIYSLVDLNNAPESDLLLLPAIDKAAATRLIQERTLRRGFERIEEVGELLHLQPHQVERLKERVEIKPLQGVNPASSTRRRVVEF